MGCWKTKNIYRALYTQIYLHGFSAYWGKYGIGHIDFIHWKNYNHFYFFGGSPTQKSPNFLTLLDYDRKMSSYENRGISFYFPAPLFSSIRYSPFLMSSFNFKAFLHPFSLDTLNVFEPSSHIYTSKYWYYYIISLPCMFTFSPLFFF